VEIVEEEYFEDADGTKKRRKIRIEKGDKTHKDKFIEEITHLECSQQFINNVIKPRNEVSKRYRDAEEQAMKIEKEFQEWKKEKFGKK